MSLWKQIFKKSKMSLWKWVKKAPIKCQKKFQVLYEWPLKQSIFLKQQLSNDGHGCNAINVPDTEPASIIFANSVDIQHILTDGRPGTHFKEDLGSISPTFSRAFFARVFHVNVFFLVTFCKKRAWKTLVKSTPDVNFTNTSRFMSFCCTA